MTSIRALHVAADEAREAVKRALLALTKENSKEVRATFLAAVDMKVEAEYMVWEAAGDLDHAAMDYRATGEATAAQYDALIAAALACHATDQEETS